MTHALLPTLLALIGLAPFPAGSAAGPADVAGDDASARQARDVGTSRQDTAAADTAGHDPVSALDSVARATMDEGRIPGLALVVIGDGRVDTARGYGVADRSSGRPVDPATTRFALGSMSKLVTAVAALQLREAGRLDLHAPASRRLPRGALPDGPGGPVTLHHLLTHTSGLESASVGVVARSASDLEGLEAHLTSGGPPRRVRPPGRLYVYSQHGYGLVGLAVEGASGRPFTQYVTDEVLRPAGMDASGFRPGALDHPATAPGYLPEDDGVREAPAAYHRIPPAGGLVAPPREMGSLVAALLQNTGSGVAAPEGPTDAGDARTPGDASGGGPGRLLPPGVADDLFARQWSPHPHPAVEGTAYGLFEYRACGIRALTSRGWVGGHSSYLHLVPERGAGFLVTANASSLQGLESTLRQELHRRLAGGECRGRTETGGGEAPSGRKSGPDSGATLSASVPGRYRSLGFASSGIESLGRTFLADEVAVRRSAEGGAEVVLGGSPVEAHPVEPRLLSAPWGEGQEELFAFVPDASGDVRWMMWGGSAYEKVSPVGRRASAWGLAAVALAVFLAGLVAPAGRAAWRRLDGDGPGPDRPSGEGPDGPPATDGESEREPTNAGADVDRALRWGGAFVSAAWLAFAAGLVAHLAGMARYTFAFGVPDTVRPFLWLPAVATAAAVAMLAGIRRVWKGGGWAAWERLQWSAVVAAALASGGWALSAGLTPW